MRIRERDRQSAGLCHFNELQLDLLGEVFLNHFQVVEALPSFRAQDFFLGAPVFVVLLPVLLELVFVLRLLGSASKEAYVYVSAQAHHVTLSSYSP